VVLSQIVSELYTAAGEPPDLEYRDPGTLAILPASQNWAELVRLVNEAQNAISTWVHQDGRRMRMRLTEDTARLVTQQVTSAVGTISGSTLTLTTNSAVRDYYRGWMVEGANGATALVFVSYIGAGPTDILLLAQLEGTFTVGEVLTLSKRSYQFVDIATATPPYADGSIYTDYTYGPPLEIVGVVGTDGTELSISDANDKMTVKGATSGQPTSYTKSFLGLRFDTYPDDAYEYVVRFMRMPRPFAVGDSAVECEIPMQFHRAIVLYCFWWLLLRSHEVDKAYAVRRNMEDILKRTQTEYDLQDRVQRGQIKLDMEG
jgi:hypothetical protein